MSSVLLPLLLAGSRTPERGARPRAGLPAQGGPGSAGPGGPRAAQHREAAQTHPRAGPGRQLTEVEVTSGFLQRYKTHNPVHVCGAVSSQAGGGWGPAPGPRPRWRAGSLDPGSARTQPGPHRHLCHLRSWRWLDNSILDTWPPCHTTPSCDVLAATKGTREVEGPACAQHPLGHLQGSRGHAAGTDTRGQERPHPARRYPSSAPVTPTDANPPETEAPREAQEWRKPPGIRATTGQELDPPGPSGKAPPAPHHLRPPQTDISPDRKGERHNFCFRFAKTFTSVCIIQINKI